MNFRRTAHLALVIVSALTPLGSALAQTKYPDQPVKVIVALPAGGSVDMIARSLGQKLRCRWGNHSSLKTARVHQVRLVCPWSPRRPPTVTR